MDPVDLAFGFIRQNPASLARSRRSLQAASRRVLAHVVAALACLTAAGTAVAFGGRAPAGVECPPPGWTVLDGAASSGAEAAANLLADMAGRAIVLLGEQHDEDDHHRWQVHTLAALHARRPDMVIGFEMFPRRVQPALDRWVAGELTVKAFLEEADWEKVWNMPAELYLPLFQFARINRIPMIALNVERSLTRAITEKGWDAVPEAEREGVGRPAPPTEAYRAYLERVHREHVRMGGRGGADEPERDFEHFIESQTTWDRAMAEALAARAGGNGAPLVVGIMGSGHIRHGHGVPHQLRALGIDAIGTLVPMSPGFGCAELRPGFADAVFALPEQVVAQPDPPRLGVRLEERDGAVHLVQVSTDSLAERSGLKTGDRVVEAAGRPVEAMRGFIALVRGQPPGTWLPLVVEREGETLELLVKFPPQR